jgi:hypothetical protein
MVESVDGEIALAKFECTDWLVGWLSFGNSHVSNVNKSIVKWTIGRDRCECCLSIASHASLRVKTHQQANTPPATSAHTQISSQAPGTQADRQVRKVISCVWDCRGALIELCCNSQTLLVTNHDSTKFAWVKVAARAFVCLCARVVKVLFVDTKRDGAWRIDLGSGPC